MPPKFIPTKQAEKYHGQWYWASARHTAEQIMTHSAPSPSAYIIDQSNQHCFHPIPGSKTRLKKSILSKAWFWIVTVSWVHAEVSNVGWTIVSLSIGDELPSLKETFITFATQMTHPHRCFKQPGHVWLFPKSEEIVDVISKFFTKLSSGPLRVSPHPHKEQDVIAPLSSKKLHWCSGGREVWPLHGGF